MRNVIGEGCEIVFGFTVFQFAMRNVIVEHFVFLVQYITKFLFCQALFYSFFSAFFHQPVLSAGVFALFLAMNQAEVS